jgi:hypothetical protein
MPGKTPNGTTVPEDNGCMLTAREFQQRNRIGSTRYYRELNSGKLKARKCGDLTLHTPEDERAWRDSLEEYKPRGVA